MQSGDQHLKDLAKSSYRENCKQTRRLTPINLRLLLHVSPIGSRTGAASRIYATTMSRSSDESSSFDTPRSVVKRVLAKPQCEGEGAVVRRSIGSVTACWFYRSSTQRF
ncbi:uncharacterized protein [Aristolochia californica]|uniref:uncharacterized protein n=1 Tax=Aristolochia californica TaxID=171875 RepID=UPI0035DED902